MRLTKILCLVSTLALPGAVHAQVASFDDSPLDSYGAGQVIPGGYSGFDWSNFRYSWYGYNPTSPGWGNAVVSGRNIAYNAFGDPAEVTAVGGGAFSVTGGYFTSGWENGVLLTGRGYREGVEIFTRSLTLNTAAPQWFAMDFLNVDRVRFESAGGLQANFLLDDLTFAPAQAVPEPGSALLLLMGLGMVGWVARSRRLRLEE